MKPPGRLKPSPLRRSAGPRSRKPVKRSQPKRDWSSARRKVDEEGRCRLWRLGDCLGAVEAAHIIGREHDELGTCLKCIGSGQMDIGPEIHGPPMYEPPRHLATCDRCDGKGENTTLFVRAERVVPLCGSHHRRYDPHTRGTQEPVDILSVLTLDEQIAAVRDAGGIGLALRRLCPTEYRKQQP